MARKSRKNLPQESEAPKAAVYAAIGYTRISNENEKSEDSIENQAEIIREYVKDKPDLDLKNVITADAGYTGTNFDRPGYAELMAGILNGETKCVIVKDLSRLGRTYIEVGELIFDTFPAHNVRFISINDHYDSFADDAARKKLLILFKNLVNHVYSKDLGKKIHSVLALKQKNGERLGGLPLYGYNLSTDGKTYVIDPEAAETVRLIFNMRRMGYGTFKIASRLNIDGVMSPRNYYYSKGIVKNQKFAAKIRWRYPQIYRILTDKQYTGCLVQGKTRVNGREVTETSREDWIEHQNAFPAIISAELFGEVQQIIQSDNRDRHTGTHDGTSTHIEGWSENILAGKIYCARCGKSTPRLENRRRTGLSYSYLCYYCNAELRNAGIKTGNFTKPFVKIEEAVTSAIRKLIDACIEFDGLLSNNTGHLAYTEKFKVLERERDGYIKERERAEQLITSVYTHHLNGLLDSREFENARKKFEADKIIAAANLERAGNALRDFNAAIARQNSALTNARKYGNFDKLTKEIVDVFVSRIEISPISTEISIKLNFTDCLNTTEELMTESGAVVNV